MYKKRLLATPTIRNFSFQLKSQLLLGLLLLASILVSQSSYALATNPGATCRGITGAAQGSLLNNDYTNLVNALNTNNFVSIMGNDSGRIPLEIKISTVESSPSTNLSNFGVIDSGSNRAINVRRNFPSPTAYTDINFEFRNTITSEPIYLTNVALSAFDIDYANSSGNRFDDFIKVTGINEAGATITGTFQQINNSNITSFDQGLRTTSTYNCPAKNLGTECQGSIQFNVPVKSVKIRYTNTDRLSANPTNQEIDFRIDNYCYVPQYIFSGIVFDDNGGIASNRADKENADITTNASAYSNNSNYFNGVFNTPPETGIAGSSVKLVSCTNTNTVYANQSVVATGATIGRYQFSLPISTFGSNTNLCLIESRTGDTYPIRTSNENKNVGFTPTNFNYPNNDFGRVIDAHAAIVLKKYQYVNDCATTLNYSAIPITADPRTGFSTGTVSESLIPGQCIAYKIVATNRANISVDNFVMRDVLQSKGVKNATTTSVLVAPVDAASNYAGNSVAIGMNGTVISNSQSIPARKTRDFYFNTKYGLTQ